MSRKPRMVRKGRYIGPFFIDAALSSGGGDPPSHFEHRIQVENTTTLPCLGVLTSETGNDATLYVESAERSTTWTASFSCVGRAPNQIVRRIEIMSESAGKPVVRTIMLLSKRNSWPDWEKSAITPVIELEWR